MVLSNGTSWSKPMRFCRGFCNFTLCLYKTVAPKAVEHKRPSSLPGVLVPASAVVTHPRRHDRRPGPRPVESKRARYSDAPVGRFKMFQVSNKQNVGFEVCGHAQIWDAAWSEIWRIVSAARPLQTDAFAPAAEPATAWIKDVESSLCNGLICINTPALHPRCVPLLWQVCPPSQLPHCLKNTKLSTQLAWLDASFKSRPTAQRDEAAKFGQRGWAVTPESQSHIQGDPSGFCTGNPDVSKHKWVGHGGTLLQA